MTLRMPRPFTLCILTVAVVLGGLALHFGIPLYHRYVALREIRQLGGDFRAGMGGPAWLRNWIPDDCQGAFGRVRAVALQNPRVSDADLRLLQAFPEMEMLGLDRSAVTNAGLAQLAGFKHLEFLSVSHTAVSEAGLRRLTNLPQLREVWATSSRVSREGIERMKAVSPHFFVYVGKGSVQEMLDAE